MLTEEVVLKSIPAKPHSLVANKCKSPIPFSTGGNIINVSWDLIVVQNKIKAKIFSENLQKLSTASHSQDH